MRSRRGLLGPLLLAAVLVVAVVVGARVPSTAADPDEVGVGARNQNALEFIGEINQRGAELKYFGYITFVRGLPPGELFSNPNKPSEKNAKLTFAGGAKIVRLTNHEDVFNVISQGDIEIFKQDDPGADFGSAASFREGKRIAAYTGRWQDVLSTLTPGDPGPEDMSAVADGVGDFNQTEAASFNAGRLVRLGREGTRHRFHFSGWGELLEPNEPRSSIDIGGYAVAP